MNSLAYRRFGSNDGPLIWILHGILGSKQNWNRFGRLLAESCPHAQVLAIDLRCHGQSSFLFDGPHTVEACAHDLYEFAQEIGYPDVVLGHSFGGKVALCYATHPQLTPALLPRAVWTLDSPLDAHPQKAQGEVVEVIDFCLNLPMPVESRHTLIQLFLDRGFSESMGQWMTTNLQKLPAPQSGFEWKFNLAGIRDLLEDYWTVDGWAHLKTLESTCEVYLLRAENGMRWSSDAITKLEQEYRFAHQPVLAQSGHWVHIDQPHALCKMVVDTLSFS